MVEAINNFFILVTFYKWIIKRKNHGMYLLNEVTPLP
jgi:hypothetical protein